MGDLAVSASIGLGMALADDTPDTLMTRADAAMYNEKFEAYLRRSDLRGQQVAAPILDLRFDEAQVRPAGTDDQSEEALRLAAALRNGEIVFWGQPIVLVQTGRPLGVELLARWPQRDGTVLGPSSFIPVAESSGLVVELGRQALSMAGRLFERWKDDEDFARLGVNVNISPLHLAHGLVDDVHALVPSLPSGSQLGLEFVETALVAGAGDHLRALDGLIDRGIRVIIDDFGIGHSSLSRLKLFPASNMKLDKSFLHNISVDSERHRFFCAIVQLLESAEYPVTVEGIETKAQLARVQGSRALGGQGFYFARPAPIGNLENMLRQLTREADEAATRTLF